ncbi:MAG TPA: hypothetical protein VG710_10135 [Opitutus sp.]|nr:hypothetical protein [Opitutus sp.]
MSRGLRFQIILSGFLAATVVVLALHQSANRLPAPDSAVTGPGAYAGKAGAGLAAARATTSAKSRTLPNYSGIGSASARRRSIIDQLRAMGVPNEVLALVALEDFESEWDGRFAACWGDPASMERVQLEKDLSQDAAMRAALGEKDFKQWDTKAMLWEAMSTPVDVTPGEAESIYALKKNLQQRQFALEQARIDGTMDRAQVLAAVQKSYADYNQELKAVLGEARYAKSQQLDDDFTAGNLRYELASVNPSDSQFQGLFKADKQWNTALAELDPGSPNYLEQFKAANEAHDQAYAQILGQDAFRNLREQQDTGYIQMKKYENLWGLDDGKIDYVYDTMNQYRKAVGDYQLQVRALQSQGQDVDWSAVNTYLQKLTGQTQQALQNTVGQDSFSSLQRNSVLRWAGAGFRPTYGGAPAQ